MHENGHNRHLRHGARAGVAGLLVLAVGGLAMRFVARSASARVGLLAGRSPDEWLLRDLVTGAALVTAAVAIVALMIGGVATALTALPLAGAPRSCALRLSRLAPPMFRRWVLVACGAALAMPLATGVASADGHHIDHRLAPPTDRPALSGLPLPDLPVAPPARTSIITVRSGDSLWSISARLLGPDADPLDIARGVAELHRLNRDAIGPDPNLIFPGTQLTTAGGTR